MAATKYNRIAEVADVESFDGSQAAAEALVTDYEGIITIQSAETSYPALRGANTLGVASTGVTATISVAPQVGDTANVITITVTHACTTSGDLSLVVDGADPVTIEVLDTDDTVDKVATKIRAATVSGWTLSGATDKAILTQDAAAQGDAILLVLTPERNYLNAYKDTYIVFGSTYHAADTTTVWKKADFEKFWVAAT